MKVIGLHGLPRSGKDTMALYLQSHHGWHKRAFATPLKEAAAILLGYEVSDMEGLHGFDREAILPDWGFSTREFLQKLGTECMRNQIRPDFWIKRMELELAGQAATNPNGKYVIADVRFPNEVELIRRMGGKVWTILRPGTKDNGHVSNQPLDTDRTIVNNGSLENFFHAIEQYDW